MRFSIITPTHKPNYLAEAFSTLRSQTTLDWEWLLVPNGGCQIPGEILDDPRVRPVVAPEYMTRQGVGALKRFACEQSRGEILVELDHDDLLAPQCLSAIDIAARKTGAGFFYSDFTNFYPNGTCQVYGDAHGWENYPVSFKGHTYTAMRAFATDPSALSAIFFAPNHVRAWTREAYFAAGAHDPLLPVCDDFDLICRTYLAGAEFHHIPECLYFYRMQEGGTNTFLQRNQEIQQRQQQVANRYIYSIINEWCRRKGHRRIDLGGGSGCPEGFTSLDVANAEIICDVRAGLPFPDNSVGCVRAYDFLQYMLPCTGVGCDHGAAGTRPRCIVGVMNEIYRVLVPGGWLISRTPSTDGRGAFQDPIQGMFWNPNSFWYYTRRDQAQTVRGNSARFQSTRLWEGHLSPWHEQHKILHVFADLVALKGQRQPGICEI